MSVQASTAPLQNVFAENTSTSYTSWKMAAGGTDGLDVVFGTGWKSGGTKRWESCSQTLTADTWHQVAISYKQGMGMSLDGGAYANNSWGSRTTASSGSSATEFAIGSRSTESGVGGRAGQWRIGKISFHTGELTVRRIQNYRRHLMMLETDPCVEIDRVENGLTVASSLAHHFVVEISQLTCCQLASVE